MVSRAALIAASTRSSVRRNEHTELSRRLSRFVVMRRRTPVSRPPSVRFSPPPIFAYFSILLGCTYELGMYTASARESSSSYISR